MAEVYVEGLTKRFRDQEVLHGVDLAVSAGELVAILGASGCGKTTLLRLLAGFERADAGRIAIGGQPLCAPGLHRAPERRHIGYVAQDGALFPHLSVGANVTFGLPWPSRRDRSRAEVLLESVGLPTAYATRAPHELSGGEQQRVALARALASGPKVVLLDEPFSALDASLRAETRQAVAAALAAVGATALLVTHDQSEALSLGHRIAVLRQGRFAQIATPSTLYRTPVDAELALFVGDAVLVPGTVEQGRARCILGQLPLAVGVADGPADIMVRPEQIRLILRPSPGAAQAHVIDSTYFGHDSIIRLSLENGADVVTARVFHGAPRPGTRVWLVIDDAVMAYPRPGR